MELGINKNINMLRNRQIFGKNTMWMACLLLLVLSVSSCKKENPISEDPYAGGKETLGIKFLSDVSDTEDVNGATQITFEVNGLMPFKDKVKFYINDTEATITKITDKTITVLFPVGASTGGTTLVVDDQIFFGPAYRVEGKVETDATFAANTSATVIRQILPLPNGNLVMVGSFNNYMAAATVKKPINNIVLTNSNGFITSGFSTGKGANGSISSIFRLATGQFIVGGSLTKYNDRDGISSITRLNTNGSLDSSKVEVVGTSSDRSYDTVATFNGGVLGLVNKVFNYNNSIYVVGSFNNYAEYFYERSTRDNKVVGYTKLNGLLKMSMEGKMDSTYNFNKTANLPYAGGNGPISDALMQSDGKIILVGSFTNYQGLSGNRIVRIGTNGLVDPTYPSGTGADDAINAITYSATSGKYLVAGVFNNYNGFATKGLVMLNADGTVDKSLVLRSIEGGSISKAYQLKSGKILVFGSFKKYDGIVRQGFMILNPNGSLAAGYNNTGKFQGIVNDVYESVDIFGNPTALIAGAISLFDNQQVSGAVRISIKP
ncbi:hypothetical protein CA265_13450 [Sphingobacteriaceae bacterium GW460-11-11-14-LB5]|nr:hypothetical protein CA265_13450 [Sphingobacteriaceae bacterium GW460-11-11-14-LB5]